MTVGGDDDPLEAKLRRRLRVVAFAVLLVLVALLAVRDAPNEFVFGSLLGAVLLVIGVEGFARLVGR